MSDLGSMTYVQNIPCESGWERKCRSLHAHCVPSVFRAVQSSPFPSFLHHSWGGNARVPVRLTTLWRKEKGAGLWVEQTYLFLALAFSLTSQDHGAGQLGIPSRRIHRGESCFKKKKKKNWNYLDKVWQSIWRAGLKWQPGRERKGP